MLRSRLWEGTLRDETKNGCVADYHGTGLKKNRCRVLDSGFHAVDSGFKLLDSGCFVRGIWIPDCNR